MKNEPFVVLGVVVSAHGVKGQFKVKPFTTSPMAIADYGPVKLDNEQWIELIAKSTAKGLVLCASPDILSREQAEALKGVSLSVDREKLPVPDEDEIYHADLLGLDVVDTASNNLGVVIGVHDFGAGEVLEIKPKGGKGSEYLPFYPPFLKQIDIQSKSIIMEKID